MRSGTLRSVKDIVIATRSKHFKCICLPSLNLGYFCYWLYSAVLDFVLYTYAVKAFQPRQSEILLRAPLGCHRLQLRSDISGLQQQGNDV